MNKKIFILIGIIGILTVSVVMALPVRAVPIENLTVETTSYSIEWQWNYNNTPNCTIWIDGMFETDTSLNNFILSNLNPREEHSIALVNTTNESNVYVTGAARTFYPPFLFYLVFIIALGLLLTEIVIKDFITIVITGTLSFVMSILGFHLSFPYHFTIFTYLYLAIGVVALLWVLLAVFTSLTQQTDIMEF